MRIRRRWGQEQAKWNVNRDSEAWRGDFHGVIEQPADGKEIERRIGEGQSSRVFEVLMPKI